MDLIEFVRESNLIERIVRDPKAHELEAHERFLALPSITTPDVERLVSLLQPGAGLRERLGQDVRVGKYFPPPGGPQIRSNLEKLLEAINDRTLSPHLTYHEYEGLHPFMDGNGRSGRAIWLWLHAQQGEGHVDSILSLGFREAWHYETLAAGAGPRAHRFDLL